MKRFLILLGLIISTALIFLSFESIFAASSDRTDQIAKKTLARTLSSMYQSGKSREAIISELQKKKKSYENQRSRTSVKPAQLKQIDAHIRVIESTLQSLGVSSQNAGISLIGKMQTGWLVSDITSEIRETALVRNFVLSNQSGSKLFDYYSYTPSDTLESNNQPLATSFISGDEQKQINIFNGYTLTALFQTVTDKGQIQKLRSQVAKSIQSASGTLTIGSWVTTLHIPLADGEFYSRAKLDPRSNIATYESYVLYIAQDNSEAFILRTIQSGSKVRIQLLDLKTLNFSANSYDPRLTFYPPTGIEYQEYFYMPGTGATIESLQKLLQFEKLGDPEFIETVHLENKTRYYTVQGYPIEFEHAKYLRSFFRSGTKGISLTNGSIGMNLLPKATFDAVKSPDSLARQYQLISSTDKSQAYLIELIQYSGR